MTVLASKPIDDARKKLQDEDSSNYRWDDADLLQYLSAAQREVVKAKPDEYPVRATLALTAGTTVQAVLPSSAWKILDVIRNMGANGLTPGPVVFYQDRDSLDRQDRMWHSGAAKSEVWAWARDPTSKTTFYVYPRVHETVKVNLELVYSDIPPDIVKLIDPILIADIHRTTLAFLTAGLALSEDDPHSDISRGAAFIKTGFALLGVAVSGERMAEGAK